MNKDLTKLVALFIAVTILTGIALFCFACLSAMATINLLYFFSKKQGTKCITTNFRGPSSGKRFKVKRAFGAVCVAGMNSTFLQRHCHHSPYDINSKFSRRAVHSCRSRMSYMHLLLLLASRYHPRAKSVTFYLASSKRTCPEILPAV